MGTIMIILLLIASGSLANNIYWRYKIENPDENVSFPFFFLVYFRFRYFIPVNKDSIDNAKLLSAKRANLSLYIFWSSFILLFITGLLDRSGKIS